MRSNEKNNRNIISYFPVSIKFGLRAYLIGKIGTSVIAVAGAYTPFRGVLKMIRLAVRYRPKQD